MNQSCVFPSGFSETTCISAQPQCDGWWLHRELSLSTTFQVRQRPRDVTQSTLYFLLFPEHQHQSSWWLFTHRGRSGATTSLALLPAPGRAAGQTAVQGRALCRPPPLAGGRRPGRRDRIPDLGNSPSGPGRFAAFQQVLLVVVVKRGSHFFPTSETCSLNLIRS